MPYSRSLTQMLCGVGGKYKSLIKTTANNGSTWSSSMDCTQSKSYGCSSYANHNSFRVILIALLFLHNNGKVSVEDDESSRSKCRTVRSKHGTLDDTKDSSTIRHRSYLILLLIRIRIVMYDFIWGSAFTIIIHNLLWSNEDQTRSDPKILRPR